MYIHWSLLFCLTCVGYHGLAQEIKVSARLDTATILLGDQTKLRLTVDLPARKNIMFPDLADTLSAKIQLVDIGKIDTLKDQQHPEQWRLSRSYTITSFDAGTQTVPAFAFKTADTTWKTDPLPLLVKSVAVDTTKAIYDIKQPLAVSYGIMDWLRDNLVLVLLIILSIVALLIGIYYVRKRRKKLPKKEHEQVVLPADVVALTQLKELRDKQLWQQDQVKLYYSELADIIREFLERRYQIRAMEQTSEEIFVLLKSKEITEVQRDRLVQVLRLADLVKFAKEQPLPVDNEQSMDNAIQFVEDARERNLEAEDKLPERDELA
ncbi:hypothetical protein GCM10023231_15780 [Olivibacter ginsenosidimutans]|uniref:Protein BatD n=2 Tax=Olivibacter ginsenosidimutans TaxID=1176537 RepID=A0ABP9B2M9_9SPHI